MSEEMREYLEKLRESRGKRRHEQNIRIEKFRMLVFGALLGVIGNFLVSFAIEHYKAEGIVDRTIGLFLTAASGALFFNMLLTVGRELQLSEKQMKRFRVSRILFPAFCVVAWALEIILPLLMNSLHA